MELAKESERLKSSFLKNINHEIRTPLNAIVGFTQLLINDEELDNKTFAKIIDKNANELFTQISNIIELSTTQSNRCHSSKSKIEIKDALNQVYTESLSYKNIKDDVEINLTLHDIDEKDIITTDKEILFQILKHLIDNALKFTKKGQVSIGCKKNKEYYCIYVNDTGIGIDKDKLPTIFNAFQKIEDHKNIHRGFGIGLALVKHLAMQININLKVKSKVDEGTKFSIYFPIHT